VKNESALDRKLCLRIQTGFYIVAVADSPIQLISGSESSAKPRKFLISLIFAFL
jgi:hypothetical protein